MAKPRGIAVQNERNMLWVGDIFASSFVSSCQDVAIPTIQTLNLEPRVQVWYLTLYSFQTYS